MREVEERPNQKFSLFVPQQPNKFPKMTINKKLKTNKLNPGH